MSAECWCLSNILLNQSQPVFYLPVHVYLQFSNALENGDCGMSGSHNQLKLNQIYSPQVKYTM